MTQYLQALKENQELRKEYQLESTVLRDQLEKLQGESGLRRPIRRGMENKVLFHVLKSNLSFCFQFCLFKMFIPS